MHSRRLSIPALRSRLGCPRVEFAPAAAAATVWCGALLAPAVWALELGPVQVLSSLGQPLFLQVPARWTAPEMHRGECLNVQVEAGDRSVPQTELRQGWVKGPTQAGKGAASAGLIWIRSSSEMVEPVLRLSLGCPAQQLTVFLDPVLVPPAAQGSAPQAAPLKDLAGHAEPRASKPVVRALKVRAERPTGPVLRMDEPGLPPLSLPAPDVPGLRFRFDSDLPSLGLARASSARSGVSEPQSRPERAVSLLMAIDVGRALGPVDRLQVRDEQGVSPVERLLQAQQQFDALQAEQRAMKAEMANLQAQLEQRQQDELRIWRLVGVFALALLVIAAGVYFISRHRRQHGDAWSRG